MNSLQLFHLNNNNFFRELPSSLENCKNLTVLDLGDNKFHGNSATWLGEGFSSLMVLQLRSNMFTGSIPPQMFLLASLQLLDLANNNLTRSIPRSFDNLTAVKDCSDDTSSNITSSEEIWKGIGLEFSPNLSLVVGMDLPSNHLTSEIPEEITRLHGLVFLNLSRNHLNGNIQSLLVTCSLWNRSTCHKIRFGL